MVISQTQQEIIADLDRLQISYQIKLYFPTNEDWQPYFHRLSLDSHRHNTLFLDRHRLFNVHNSSLALSGLALSKKHQIRNLSLINDWRSLTATIGGSSPQLGKRLPNLQGSANARWRCEVPLNPNKEIQNFDLVITLDNGSRITFCKVEFRQIALARHHADLDRHINQKLAERIQSIQQSRQLMANNAAAGRFYLFAIGNARSGTTALGKLLNYSSAICLGLERYSQHENVSATSFSKAAFFDAQSKNYQVRPHFYENIKNKFDRARYVGDKRPGFVRSWRNTWLNLPAAKIVYIFRNVRDVACSYNSRADNAAQGSDPLWSTERDFVHAVRDWNKGLREIGNLMHFYEVYLVKYEDFFVDPAKMIHLFNYLGLEPSQPEIAEGIDKSYRAALALQGKSRVLSDEQLEYVNSNADFESYNNLLTLYEKQFSDSVLSYSGC